MEMRRGRLTAMYTKNQDDEISGAFKPGRVLIVFLIREEEAISPAQFKYGTPPIVRSVIRYKTCQHL